VSKKAKSVSRIYAVTRKGHGTLRLVKAGNWAQALRHVAKDEYAVDVAEQDQLVEAVNRGVKVEVVTESKPILLQVDASRIAEIVAEHARPLVEGELPADSPLVRGDSIDPTLS
jgi:hypothetical protein